MNAYVLKAKNSFGIQSVSMPILKNNEVMINVKAVGICGSDIPRIYTEEAHVYPLIPGHEFSGIVTEIGLSADSSWNGKRVGVYPLIPCGKCIPCCNNKYEMCRNYNYLGSRKNGGFAEYVAVPEQNLILLSDNVTYEEAALLEPMAVAIHAMREINVKKQETVVIFGMGTIGLLLYMVLKEAGVKHIYAVGNKKIQQAKLIQMGILENDYFDSRNQSIEQWISEKTNGIGADISFECVGKNTTILQAITSTKAGGKVMLVGNPHSDIKFTKSIYWKILRNQLTVKGTWNSSFVHNEKDDWHYALDLISKKQNILANLITHRLSFDELEKGLEIMRDKKEEYVKIIGNF